MAKSSRLWDGIVSRLGDTSRKFSRHKKLKTPKARSLQLEQCEDRLLLSIAPVLGPDVSEETLFDVDSVIEHASSTPVEQWEIDWGDNVFEIRHNMMAMLNDPRWHGLCKENEAALTSLTASTSNSSEISDSYTDSLLFVGPMPPSSVPSSGTFSEPFLHSFSESFLYSLSDLPAPPSSELSSATSVASSIQLASVSLESSLLGDSMVISTMSVDPPSISVSGDTVVDEGTPITLTVDVSNLTDTLTKWTINWGDETVVVTPPTSGNDWGDGVVQVDSDTWTFTHTYADGSYNRYVLIDAEITDALSNTSTISAYHPSIPGDANLDGVVDGSDVTIMAGNWGATSATWNMGDFNGDEVVDDFDELILSLHWQQNINSSYGGVTVNNVAPILTITGNESINEGSEHSITLSATDPGDDTITKWEVTWGDGQTSIGTKPVKGDDWGNGIIDNGDGTWTATHTYVDNGDYTITATATDEDGTWDAYDSTGMLDKHFGDRGVAIADFGTDVTACGYDMAVLSNGKIVMVGEAMVGSDRSMAIAMFNADGTPDTTFFGDGTEILNVVPGTWDRACGVTVQDDGKIVVAGYAWKGTNDYDMVLARYSFSESTSQWALDTTFDEALDGASNADGIIIVDSGNQDRDYLSDVDADSNGVIYAVGYGRESATDDMDITLLRYDPTTGNINQSVVPYGDEWDEGKAVLVQPDGKVVVGGVGKTVEGYWNYVTYRYEYDSGTDSLVPDTTWGNNANAMVDIDTFVNVNTSNNYTSNYSGVLGLAYNDNGTTTLTDDTILSTGGERFLLAEHNISNGAATFAVMNDLPEWDRSYSATITDSGKYILGGISCPTGDYSSNPDFTVLRYNSDQTVDTTFGSNGWTATDISGVQDLAVSVAEDSTGGILAAGSTYVDAIQQFALIRHYEDNPGLDVTVNNVVPTLTLSGDFDATEGSEYTLTVSAPDPGADTVSSLTITWGDGTTSTGTKPSSGNDWGNGIIQNTDGTWSATHTYPTGGTDYRLYSTSVSVTDEDGTWTDYTHNASIVVSTLNDAADDGNYSPGNLSLREALILANLGVGKDTITFDPSFFASGPNIMTLNGTEVTVNTDVTIQGPGADLFTIDGNDLSRVFYVQSAEVTFANMTITGGIADNGGGIRAYNADIEIDSVHFFENSATAYGGGISLYASAASVSNTTFTNNTAQEGGGLNAKGGGCEVTVSTSIFTGNSATNSGGGLHNDYTTTIIDSDFIANTAGQSGGGVIVNGGTLNISGNSTFTDNEALNGGGVRTYNCAVNIDDTSFSGNSASELGGAAYLRESTTVVSNSEFSSNTASLYGGGIYALSSDLDVSDTTFSGNESETNSGGAVSLHYATGTITDSTFENNSANYHGGGIYAFTLGEAGLDVTGSTFSGNQAASNGGGVFLQHSNGTITDSDFTDNSSGYRGGAFYGSDSDFSITGSMFTDNESHYGGGIAADASSIFDITDSVFSGNAATTAYGGGIYLDTVEATMSGLTLSNNSAVYHGGGIFGTNSLVAITASTLFGNTANQGGGLHFRDGSNATVTNSILYGNTASQGGGIYIYGTYSDDGDDTNDSIVNLAVINSTIAANAATNTGGGIYKAHWDSVTLANTIVAQNTATTSDPDIYGVLASGNSINSLIGDGTGQINLTNGIDGNQIGTATTPINPGFVDLNTNDYRLSDTSPAINAGDNTTPITYNLTTDLLGNARTIYGTTDIGAYEYKPAPVVQLTNEISIGQFDLFTIDAIITDPGFAGLSTEEFYYSIDWGDGHKDVGLHVYSNGSYDWDYALDSQNPVEASTRKDNNDQATLSEGHCYEVMGTISVAMNIWSPATARSNATALVFDVDITRPSRLSLTGNPVSGEGEFKEGEEYEITFRMPSTIADPINRIKIEWGDGETTDVSSTDWGDSVSINPDDRSGTARHIYKNGDEEHIIKVVINPDETGNGLSTQYPLVPGDANCDGKVDGSDVTILAGNWQAGVSNGVIATWSMGDFNNDTKVDGSDVTILAGNWQKEDRIIVQNVAPTLTVSGNESGSERSITISAYDPGSAEGQVEPDEIDKLIITWADGSTSTGTKPTESGNCYWGEGITRNPDGTWTATYSPLAGDNWLSGITVTAFDQDSDENGWIGCECNEAPAVQNTQGWTILETAESGDIVGQIFSTDKENEILTYSIVSQSSSAFEIDPTSGLISVKDASNIPSSSTVTFKVEDASHGTNTFSLDFYYEVNTITDTNLSKAIRETLDLQDNELLTTENLASLTTLSADSNLITSLEGLVVCNALIDE